MSIVLFKSNPSTGEIYETKTVNTPEEKEFAMSLAGGGWWETPRWQRDPKGKGIDPTNPFEAVVPTPYVEYPRTLHQFTGYKTITDPLTKETRKEPVFIQKMVNSDDEKADALKLGWTLGATVPEKKATAA